MTEAVGSMDHARADAAPEVLAEERPVLWHRVILAVTGHFRRQRGAELMRTFPDLDRYRVCDLGGSRHFWISAALSAQPESVEVLNISMEDINAAGIHEDRGGAERFSYEVYDGSTIPRADGYYDLLICNSVLEHVPSEQRAALSAEMSRVATRLFVQTPAKGFVVDPHFIMPLVHWVPRGMGRRLARVSPWRILTRSDRTHTDAYFDGTKLLGRRELLSYFPTGRLVVERFLGMPKSYIVVADEPARRTRSPHVDATGEKTS